MKRNNSKDLFFQETGKDKHVQYWGSYQTEKNVRRSLLSPSCVNKRDHWLVQMQMLESLR